MSKSSNKYSRTIRTLQKLDELDSSAMIGRMVTEEELAEIIRSNQDGTAILECLVKIRDKQKRLKKLWERKDLKRFRS